jgi:hypothetical protein
MLEVLVQPVPCVALRTVWWIPEMEGGMGGKWMDGNRRGQRTGERTGTSTSLAGQITRLGGKDDEDWSNGAAMGVTEAMRQDFVCSLTERGCREQNRWGQFGPSFPSLAGVVLGSAERAGGAQCRLRLAQHAPARISNQPSSQTIRTKHCGTRVGMKVRRVGLEWTAKQAWIIDGCQPRWAQCLYCTVRLWFEPPPCQRIQRCRHSYGLRRQFLSGLDARTTAKIQSTGYRSVSYVRLGACEALVAPPVEHRSASHNARLFNYPPVFLRISFIRCCPRPPTRPVPVSPSHLNSQPSQAAKATPDQAQKHGSKTSTTQEPAFMEGTRV